MGTSSGSGTNTAAHQLAGFLRAHVAQEEELLREYRRLGEELPTPALRYFARLIHSDDERHQMIFGDLAETVYATDDLKASGMPILDKCSHHRSRHPTTDPRGPRALH
jgi:hypothetical protein